MNQQCEPADCGVAKALGVIGGKWTMLIVRDLIDEPRRFCELEQSLNGISPRTLTIRLKELEQDGILSRSVERDRVHPRYCLTEKGQSLQEIVEQLRSWGNEHETQAVSARL